MLTEQKKTLSTDMERKRVVDIGLSSWLYLFLLANQSVIWTSDLQIGQIMFYLLASQLKAVTQRTNPTPLLGIFMADGSVRKFFFVLSTFYELLFN